MASNSLKVVKRLNTLGFDPTQSHPTRDESNETGPLVASKPPHRDVKNELEGWQIFVKAMIETKRVLLIGLLSSL
jgi:hypothetical protein